MGRRRRMDVGKPQCYNGLSVLPFLDHTYKQAPFEDCSETYEALLGSLTSIDLTQINEEEDNTVLKKSHAPVEPAK